MPDTEDLQETIDAALDSEEFDVLEFVQGTNTPEETVDIFTNGKAAYALSAIFEKEKAAAQAREEARKKPPTTLGLADEDEFYFDEDEVNDLTEQLNDSKLTFALKGLLPVELTALQKKLQATTDYTENGKNEEYNRQLSGEIFVHTIQTVTNAQGRVQRKRFSVDGIYKLYDSLYPEQQVKLETAIWKVTALTTAFADAVTADFS